jgi:rubredoxin
MGLTIICPECGARTPCRTIHDVLGTASVVWACDLCGFAWDAAPLAGRHEEFAEGTTPPRAA